jgi:Anti-sigma-K factor rskA
VEQAAPGRLRQRVMGAVHGETWVGPRAAGPTARPSVRARAVAVATLIVLGVAGGLALDHSSTSRTARASQPNSTFSARTTRASLRRAGPHTELLVSRMPEPPVGEVYEVWLNRPSTAPQPTDALFTVTSEGNGAVEVPGNLRGVREVTVTSEPLGGSSSPTSAPVLRLPVSQRH